MPIRKENQKFYRGEAWDETRRRILKRAKNQCEFCAKPHNRLVYVTRDGTGRWNIRLTEHYANVRLLASRVRKELSARMKGLSSKSAQRRRGGVLAMDIYSEWYAPKEGLGVPAVSPESGYIFCIKVVLTIAHLNHTPGDDREENLKALCQRCHLAYDAEYHRMRRAERKDKERPILVEIERQQAHQ